MVDHVRRFNPSHQWIHNKIAAGELTLQQLDVQTYFFRRANTNAKGEARTWTDHLLWHHACHTVDLFQYQTGGQAVKAQGLQGPLHLAARSFATSATTEPISPVMTICSTGTTIPWT